VQLGSIYLRHWQCFSTLRPLNPSSPSNGKVSTKQYLSKLVVESAWKFYHAHMLVSWRTKGFLRQCQPFVFPIATSQLSFFTFDNKTMSIYESGSYEVFNRIRNAFRHTCSVSSINFGVLFAHVPLQSFGTPSLRS